MVVYVDLLFLINLLIDGALLLVTAWTLKTVYRLWRIAAAAALGALYVVLLFFPNPSFLFSFGAKALVSLAMLAIAFGYGGLGRYLRHLGAFYLVNFAVAGGIFALSYLLMSSDGLMAGILFSRLGGMPFSSGLLGVLLCCFLWLFYRLFQSSRTRQQLSARLAEVRIELGGHAYSCAGLVDTGNQLYDPLTRTPVMIIEAAEWKDVIPETWIKQIRSSEADRIITAIGEGDYPFQDRLRLVPYRGVNRGTQFLLALKPDLVTVRYEEQEWETSRVLVGLDGGRLSRDGSYRAILHPKLLEA
ncbi:sigma-E processing peptidase SpoIIGA [Gorillibacterium sp. sgz500922]|uniref:sigma-E processing peptidase SpoIIGA n=1 Tax=Gorillibacterium sp. sgz500922 TaxID=3446694 RepID=UPI003F661E32